MKKPEYDEGPKAQQKFEQAMCTLFKAPKALKHKPKKRKKARIKRLSDGRVPA
jgi:hypothetical protein